ncbi:5'-3' exoribonuclease [Hirschfeldia incana]|nr:5'-3' exoribonuclease [Hirschfeldia incana]
MGVPSFYRWLIERYPLILQDVIEEEPLDAKVRVDTSKPNPNGVEYDNLYLDMNGIIHPCFHPEDRASPTTFSEVFQCMFDYIDRLFVMVRPRKLLFLAIDGVAPRAKMNQQRSRRFRAAKDAAEAAAEEERLRQEFESEGKRLPPKLDSQVFDSNVITPGTEFMSTLSFALQYYIHLRLNSDPGWKNIKVILSDANVPGEGEHKIMSYIRLQKNHPGYNPNTCHCLYGLDADLIMLALATHEVHISILREVVFTPGEQDKCFLCGQLGHRAADCEGKVKRKAGDLFDKPETDVVVKKPYQFVNIWTLREYLEHDMQIPNSQLQKHLDRIIDDFIFICFFVGNDFLPHMPTLEIREGAIELLMSVYKKEFGSSTSYLSNGSKLNLKNVEHFIQAVGLYENNIFQRRAQNHQRQSERFSRDRAQSSRNCNYDPVVQLDSLVQVSHSLRPSLDDNTSVANVETEYNIKEEELDNSEELKFKLKKLLREKSDGFSSGKGEEDKVRLGVQGWRERYYEEKFMGNTIEEMEQIRKDVVLKYTEGLCWIMHYYYHGVCSWNWFYPYHYAPFASDLKLLDKLDIKFELGSPFKPFNQLLAVLPSASAHALPECFRKLMTDPNSPIAEFYPPDFEIDMNGKRYSWQGIAKLPFIEEQRLLDAAAKVEHSLTKEEVRRNSVLSDMLFVVSSHPLAELIRSLSSRNIKLSNKEREIATEKIDPGLSEGMNGYLALCGGDSQPSSFRSPIEGMEDVLANQVICAIYKLPDDLRGSDIARPPPGVVLPKKTVQLADLKGGANLWHEDGDRKRAPAKIIKIKRYNPQGSISGDRLGKAAHRLVLETINSQPGDTHINSEPALCPNAIFHNNQVTKKVASFRESAVQKKHPQCELALRKNRSHQSELTVEEKRAIRKRKEKEKRMRNLANRRDRAKNEQQQGNKGERKLENKRPRSEVSEDNRLEHKRPRLTEERNINTEGKEQNKCAQTELTEEKNGKRKKRRRKKAI